MSSQAEAFGFTVPLHMRRHADKVPLANMLQEKVEKRRFNDHAANKELDVVVADQYAPAHVPENWRYGVSTTAAPIAAPQTITADTDIIAAISSLSQISLTTEENPGEPFVLAPVRRRCQLLRPSLNSEPPLTIPKLLVSVKTQTDVFLSNPDPPAPVSFSVETATEPWKPITLETLRTELETKLQFWLGFLATPDPPATVTSNVETATEPWEPLTLETLRTELETKLQFWLGFLVHLH